MAATANAQRNDLGAKSLVDMQRLLRAADDTLSSYRSCPNYPELQTRKAAIWAEYQACLAELDEAMHA